MTNLAKADLTACRVYGISAWDINLTDAIQKNIIITPYEQPTIPVAWRRTCKLALDVHHRRVPLGALLRDAAVILQDAADAQLCDFLH